MTVTKLDAAICQLETAVRLFFEGGDPVSVHTLAHAADEILNRLCEARGLSNLRSEILNKIVPDRVQEVADALNSRRNFFKHARPETLGEKIEITDEMNRYVLMSATNSLQRLSVQNGFAGVITGWMMAVEPGLFNLPEQIESLKHGALGASFERMSLAEQKAAGLDLISALQPHCLSGD